MLGSLVAGLGAGIGGYFNYKAAQDQQAMQLKFAKNAIQWKAADAEKAGISKLYGIGAPTMSYSPVSTGLGASGAIAGQALGRGIDAQQSQTSRVATLQQEIASAQLEGIKTDNQIKQQDLLSRSAVRSQPGTPPALTDADTMPLIPGQGDAPGRIDLKKTIAPAGYDPNNPQKSFGVSPEVDMYRAKHGFVPQVPQNLQEAFESDALSRWQWNIRNKVLPYTPGESNKTVPFPAEGGGWWIYEPMTGKYELIKPGGDPKGTHSAQWEYLMDKLRRKGQ